MKRYEIRMVVSVDDDELYSEAEWVLHSAQKAIAINTDIWPYAGEEQIRELADDE